MVKIKANLAPAITKFAIRNPISIVPASHVKSLEVRSSNPVVDVPRVQGQDLLRVLLLVRAYRRDHDVCMRVYCICLSDCLCVCV